MKIKHFFILNTYWIKGILKMNNGNDLNPDVLVASNKDISGPAYMYS